MSGHHSSRRRTGATPAGREPPARSKSDHTPPARDAASARLLALQQKSGNQAVRGLLPGGEDLPPPLRADMEARFGEDFSDVRIHAGPSAADLAARQDALAFTLDNQIVFGAQQFAPDDPAGRRLLAHELAHVVQQRHGRDRGAAQPPGAAAERDAATSAENVITGRAANVAASSAIGIARQSIPQARIDYEPAPNAYQGIELEYAARGFYPVRGVQVPGRPYKAGFYWLAPHVLSDTDKVVYYLAYNPELRRNEFVIGPAEVQQFLANENMYRVVAAGAYPLTGDVPEYKAKSGQMVSRAMRGDLKGMLRAWAGSWSSAVRDPGFWVEAATAGVPAGRAKPPVPRAPAPPVAVPRPTPAPVAPSVRPPAPRPAAPARPAPPSTPQPVAKPAPLPPATAAPQPASAPAPVAPKSAAPRPAAPSAAAAPSPKSPPKRAKSPAKRPKQATRPAAPSAQAAKPPKPTAAKPKMKRTQPTGAKPTRPPRASTRPFMRDALKKVSDPKHPLHKLVVPKKGPKGQVTYDWRKTTRETKAGKTQTGRYEGHEHGPTVQAGHPDAYASGAPQRYVLEDADLNQLSGRTIESKGAFSFKEAVEVDGVWVDLQSLQQWERLGVVPPGTVARATR